MRFDGGREEAQALAWAPTLPGVLDSHRASWKSVWLRTGWGHLQQPLLTALKALGEATSLRLSEEKPIFTLIPPRLPWELLVWATRAGKTHTNSDAWRAFPNPPGTNLPGHYADVHLSPPTLTQLLKP